MVRTATMRKALGAAVVLGCASAAGVWSNAVVAQAQPSQVKFATHVIGGNVQGGYQVTAVDLNKDGKLDLLGLGLSRTGSDLAWFENPTWTRHVMAAGVVNMINLAPYDVDGDGIPEIGVAHGFATSIANSPGGVSILTHGPNVTEPWTRKDIDTLPTAHRLRWVNADGQKKVVLVNAPLIGPTAKTTEDHAKNAIVYYEAPDWKRQVMTEDEEGVIHGILPTAQTPFGNRGAESLLSASFLGVFQHQWQDGKWARTRVTTGSPAPWPKGGTSDIAVGRHGTANVMSAIEPWHGNEVVLYRQDGTTWVRQMLDDQITDGHALAMADFAGDGRSAIVAGERNGKRSVYVYWPPAKLGDAWTKQVLDDAMNASGCVTADLNGDKRPDIACIAGGTTGVKWYENLGR